MTRPILGLVYLNAHGALVGAADLYRHYFYLKGYSSEVLNLTVPGAIEELDRRLNNKEIAFCYAPQGVGPRLGNDAGTIWKQKRVPFIGLHGDNPCYNIFNHFGDTPYIANLYLYESFAELSRRYIHTDQIVDTIPFQVHGLASSPIPYRERPVKMLYLKTGESVEECASNLNSLPPLLRDGVWQQLERAYKNPNLLVCDLVQEVFDQLNETRQEHFDLFWGCAHWMDMYLRRKRAADFVDWLKMQEGAVIVGNGWDFIDTSNARALFRPNVGIVEAASLYQHCQIVFNTSPYGRDIIHERAVFGLLNESMTVTDTNAWWEQNFSDVPALRRFEWGRSLDEQLQPILNMAMTEAEAQASTGRAPALAHFTGQDMAQKLLDCAAKIDPECLQ